MPKHDSLPISNEQRTEEIASLEQSVYGNSGSIITVGEVPVIHEEVADQAEQYVEPVDIVDTHISLKGLQRLNLVKRLRVRRYNESIDKLENS